jgi:hypothetical protein
MTNYKFTMTNLVFILLSALCVSVVNLPFPNV